MAPQSLRRLVPSLGMASAAAVFLLCLSSLPSGRRKLHMVKRSLSDNTSDVLPHVTPLLPKSRTFPQLCSNGTCEEPLQDACMSYEQITWYLKHLEEEHSHNVKLVAFTSTYENRKVHMVIIRPYLVKSSKNAKPYRGKRPKIWLEGGFEADNCLHTMTLLHIIHRLAKDCTQECTNDYYVVPLANPDGHEYARLSDSAWMKNRVPFDNGCFGINLNRNFPPVQNFYKTGSSDPCSDDYRGPRPASAGEVSTIIGLKFSFAYLNLTLSFSGAGGEVLYPFAINASKVPDAARYQSLGLAYADAAEGFTVSSYGSRHPARAGTAMDFWHHHDLSEFPFTVRLRGVELRTGLQTSVKDTWAGLVGVLRRLKVMKKGVA